MATSWKNSIPLLSQSNDESKLTVVLDMDCTLIYTQMEDIGKHDFKFTLRNQVSLYLLFI